MANRQIEIENKAMKEILIAMHNLGGQVTRKQVLQELRDNSDVFSEKEIDAEFGIFITNSDFTREAVKTAREGTRIITLINGDQICDLVAKYNYYVEPVTTYRLKDFYLDKD